jgi:hypothetical protein
MNQANRKLLDEYRQYHTTLVKAGYMMGLSSDTRDNMARIMSEEFQPGYATDLWCPPCVSDMVLLLYRYYDAWIEANPDPVEEPAPVPIPVKEEQAAKPIITKAIFPKHNRGR